jgi:outer membrane protein
MVIDVSTQQSPVLWAAQSVDITKPIIEAYNQESGVPAPPKPAATSGTTAPRKPASNTLPSAPKPASSTTPK